MRISRLVTSLGYLLLVILLSRAGQAVAWVEGTNIPPRSQWGGVMGGVFMPQSLNSGRLFYIAAIPNSRPIPWTIRQGEASYFNIYMPAGVKQINMGINAQSLAASQSIMVHDYGESTCTNPVQLPTTPTAQAYTDGKLDDWKVLTGAGSDGHRRADDSPFMQTGSCLLFAFYNDKNLFESGIQLDDVAFTYLIEDEALFQEWANRGDVIETLIDVPERDVPPTFFAPEEPKPVLKTVALPVQQQLVSNKSEQAAGEITEWEDGVNLPETFERNGAAGGVFDPARLANGRLFYIAAIPNQKPIRWVIRQGESAYFNIYMPAGVKQINMGINAQALAASQSVVFRSFGESDCNNFNIPTAPSRTTFNGGVSNAGWKTFTGASNDAYKRPEGSEFFATGSCLFFAFYNLDNRFPSGIQLDDVAFTYTIGDEAVFKQWASNIVIDTDNDGVKDESDQCPNTPANTAIDVFGCPLPVDSDVDGVNNIDDQCPNTPANTIVDGVGCPKKAEEKVEPPKEINPTDGDEDGVLNENDKCLNTSPNSRVDAEGCSTKDSDGDLVTDDKDRCPNTDKIVEVGTDGCTIVDSDGDGINDDLDLCKETLAESSVDSTGCVAILTLPINNSPCGSAAFCMKNGKLILPAVRLAEGDYRLVELTITQEKSGEILCG